MHNNRRGLIMLGVLLVIAVMVYALKNQRQNPGSYVSEPQQAKVEASDGEFVQDTDPASPHNRLNLGRIKAGNDLR